MNTFHHPLGGKGARPLQELQHDKGIFFLLLSAHAQKTPEDMTTHQYLNILANSIIYDETGGSFEYRHITKRDKHKKYMVEIFCQ